jgi:DNA polymerase
MDGFFTRKEVESISRPDGKLYTCVSCGLYKNVKSPKMKPYGNFKKKIMIIGEAPGEVEDTKGKPWQGKTGLLLQRTCQSLGVDIFEDCVNINACHCRPSDDNDKTALPPT